MLSHIFSTLRSLVHSLLIVVGMFLLLTLTVVVSGGPWAIVGCMAASSHTPTVSRQEGPDASTSEQKSVNQTGVGNVSTTDQRNDVRSRQTQVQTTNTPWANIIGSIGLYVVIPVAALAFLLLRWYIARRVHHLTKEP